MNAFVLAFRLLPLAIKLAEMIIGAQGAGKLKKGAVQEFVLSAMQTFNLPIPQGFDLWLSTAIDGIVALLNETVWKKA